MKVAYIGGLWSRNIGNAFYNLGTEAFLKKVGIEEVYFVPDPPQWESPMVCGDFDLIGNLKVDLVLLTGPCLNLRFEKIYAHILEKLTRRNIPFAFLSAGMSLYDTGEANCVQQFLARYKPRFVLTRDALAASLLKSAGVPNVDEGICMSMYLDDAVQIPSLDIGEYIVLNFDSEEPVLEGNLDSGFIARPRRWKDRGFPSDLGGLPIIRTRNDSVMLGDKAIYSRPISYHSDLPYGYLALLGGAAAVLTERVHTCAAAIVLGGRSQFFAHAPRAKEKRVALLEKIGAKEALIRPIRLNRPLLEKEKFSLEQKFRSLLSSF
jgi:hypothetical protein